MNYYILTFGCQMNKSDSERITSVLENLGYQEALKENEADLILVNMCSVRQSAVDRVYGLSKKFKELKKKNENLKTLLTGCISNSDYKKFQNFFDYVLSIKALNNWPEFLKKDRYLYYPNPRTLFEARYLNKKSKYSNNFSAFIPISSGCDNFCTFCIVPYVRGPLVCRPYEDILKEVKFSVETGAKEIWLLGQNVNRYRSNLKLKSQNSKVINFAELLRMVNDIPGNFWIRFTSPHPADFSDELIETMAKCQKIAPYLNLPIQSGDDEILRRMNRPYNVSYYKNLIKKIRAAFKKYRKAPKQNKFATGQGLEKEVAISTDVIVGFPGETKKQFLNTIKLFKGIKFDMAYIARYSPRPGTAALRLKDDISLKEKERRYKILTEILKKTALEKNKKFIGKEVEALPEEEKNGFLIGKSRHYKTVKIDLKPKAYNLKPNFIGNFIKVKIIDALPWGLKGILIEK